MLIWGSRMKTKPLGEEMLYCDYCRQDTMHTFVQRQSWFTLYFIPIFATSPQIRTGQCNVCGSVEHGDQEALVVEPGSADTKQCSECKEWIKAEAFACSKCGHIFTNEEVKAGRERTRTSKDADPDALHKRLHR
jgi:hypothetical protein